MTPFFYTPAYEHHVLDNNHVHQDPSPSALVIPRRRLLATCDHHSVMSIAYTCRYTIPRQTLGRVELQCQRSWTTRRAWCMTIGFGQHLAGAWRLCSQCPGCVAMLAFVCFDMQRDTNARTLLHFNYRCSLVDCQLDTCKVPCRPQARNGGGLSKGAKLSCFSRLRSV